MCVVPVVWCRKGHGYRGPTLEEDGVIAAFTLPIAPLTPGTRCYSQEHERPRGTASSTQEAASENLCSPPGPGPLAHAGGRSLPSPSSWACSTRPSQWSSSTPGKRASATSSPSDGGYPGGLTRYLLPPLVLTVSLHKRGARLQGFSLYAGGRENGSSDLLTMEDVLVRGPLDSMATAL